MIAPDPSILPPPLPEHVQEQLDTLTAMRARTERGVGREQRAVESITAVLGRPRTIWALLAAVSTWAAVNMLVGLAGPLPPDPPPFFWLQGAVGLYAAIASTVVLTTQIRQSKHAEQRALLELQVNLLAEQKTAKIIHLLEELRRDMPAVPNRVDAEAESMMTAINPRAVLSALEGTLDLTTASPLEETTTPDEPGRGRA